MRRNDINVLLRERFTPERGYGVEHGPGDKYQSHWFVVPPHPEVFMQIAKLPSSREAIAALSRANKVINGLPSPRDIPDSDKLIYRLLARSEAVASSRMEGTFSTVSEVFGPETESSSETRSVIGYAKALESLLNGASNQNELRIDSQLICAIHRSVMMADPSQTDRAGRYREEGHAGSIVHIGGGFRIENSIYNPALPQRVDSLLEAFFAWMGDEDLRAEGDQGIRPMFSLPVRMALAHAHFEAIHPFSDGNGRVGRILLAAQMMQSKLAPLYLSGFIEAMAKEYMSALQEFQKKLRLQPMLEFICEAIGESALEHQRTAHALQGLVGKWRAKHKFRAKSSAERLLDFIRWHPVISIEDVMQELRVSEPAAGRAVKQLQEKGILSETTGNQRNRRYKASEVLSVLARRFGDSV